MTAPEPTDVERLRAALAASTGAPASPVDTARIFDALHGALSDAERQELVDALVDDPEASEAWRLAMDLAPDVEAAGTPPVATPTWRWLGLAAGLVLAAGLGWQLLGPSPGGDPIYRSVEGRTIASLLPEGAPLSRRDPVLKWTVIDGARYRVRVLTANLEPLEDIANLTAPEVRLRDGVLERVPAGSLLLWQVEAYVTGAATVVSPTFTVRLQ